jgi:hypothetical protein
MIKQIIDAFKETSLKHILVNDVFYQDQINLQPNNKYFQVSIENDPIMTTIGKLQLNINVLGLGDELETQDKALQIGLAIIDRTVATHRSIMNLDTCSALAISKISDDLAAGVRFSIVLTIPLPIDYCTLNDYFSDKVKSEEPTLDLKPILLK